MGEIEKRIDRARELTVYRVSGRVSAEEYKRNIQDFYDKGPITNDVVWDLSRAELDHLLPDDVKNIGAAPRKFIAERSDGRTAIIAPDDLAFGLARMYEFTADPVGVPIEIRVFRSPQEADQWLQGK